MSRHMSRLTKALGKLGLANGSALYFRYVLHRLVPRLRWSLRATRIRGVSRPVWMRPGVSDWIVMERIFLDLEYAPGSEPHDDALATFYADTLARGKIPLIIDCGANIGLSSIWFSERFPRATILAIEPEPNNFAVLARNGESFSNIMPLQAAISDRAGSVSLVNDIGTPWAWQTRPVERGGIACVTIPELVASNPRFVPFIVKIDIEGFETNLLRNNPTWVGGVPLIVFEMHDWMAPWSGSGNAFFSTLSRQMRDYLICGENVFAYSHEALVQEGGGELGRADGTRTALPDPESCRDACVAPVLA